MSLLSDSIPVKKRHYEPVECCEDNSGSKPFEGDSEDNDTEEFEDTKESNNVTGMVNSSHKRPKKQNFTFGACKICNDKATGVHYGITTCEGCKGFFKRNIQRNTFYQCFFGRNCILTPRTRNRCKACRFKRCIEVGMSFDGIKMGRIPKAIKKQALENQLISGGSNDSPTNSDTTRSNPSESEVSPNSSNLNYPTKLSPSGSSYNGSLNHCHQRKNSCTTSESNSLLESRIFNEDQHLPKSIVSNKTDSSTPPWKNSGSYVKPDFERYISQMNKNKMESFDPVSNLLLEVSPNKLKPSSSSSLSTPETLDTSDNKPTNTDTLNSEMETSLAHFLQTINSVKTSLFHKNTQTSPAQSSTMAIFKEKTDSITDLVSSQKAPGVNNFNIKSNFLSFYMSKTKFDPSYQVICSVLNDKIFQLYMEYTKSSTDIYNRVVACLKRMSEEGDAYLPDKDFEMNNATFDLIWDGLINSLPQYVQSTFFYCKEMPGINELEPKDFAAILNNKLFEIFIIIHSKFFINGESYLRLSNNVHYSRHWMLKVKGRVKTEATFELANTLNEFEMTLKEKALLLPLIMTMPENIEEEKILGDLNEYYTRAILYEFDLSKRDESFILKLSKVIQKIKEVKLIDLSANDA